MEIKQIEQRIEEANRERDRLQQKNMLLIREISETERNKTVHSQELRAKSEREIAQFESKANKELDYLQKDLHRAEMLINANNINILNLQRLLTNAKMNGEK